MQQTGIKAFILSDGTCNPKWDGSRSLTGSDKTLINSIRAAGGDAVPSIGGWSGNELGQFCGWAVNRDRGNCRAMSSSCSGIDQQTYEFSKALAKFTG